ncbi:MAG: hypothetical protein GEV28_04345 [Actinophytocola sp.]|uniref:hypothetical protein n=1 Tax=Actinophytocola sp. TaxID=1872138 RepID=UPI001328ED11|nr:hypothetical protein [Actinophytocola sp.]MPZ79654.1 hypothetical protein [Actinophytocola sp.]
MATSTPPTVRPHRRSSGSVETAATADRVMLSPVTDAGDGRPSTGRRRWRMGWMLALGLTVLLGAALSISAAASPSVASPGAGSAAAQPAPTPPLPPFPPVDNDCIPGTICTPVTTTEPVPTTLPPLPTEQPEPLPPCDPTLPMQPCQPSGAPTPTTPCTGEDCIPQPTTPSPDTGEEPGQPEGDSGEADCGFTDIGGCITNAINALFKSLVDAALSPILELLSHTALSTPTLDQLPGIGELWNNSWQLVLASYGLLILVGGIVVMTHESIQTRYSIKEIGPRIPIGFLASMLSLFFADKFIRIANALSQAVLGDGVNAPSLGSGLSEAVAGATSGGLFIILMGLVLVVVGIGLLIVYVIRVVITLILIISGPLFLMCHCLPHTDPLARWWWKALAATLAIQVAQSLVLITAVRTFLSGGVHLFGSTLSALGTVVSAIALFFILFKIPFWLLSAVKVSNGRSLLGGLARAYIAAKTFGMIAGKSGAFGKAGTATAATSSGGGRGGTPADPPLPAQPRIAPTPEAVNRRLRERYDAERVRAARRSRLPSQAPRFLQPGAQATTHDPAISPATQGPAVPEFSSAPTDTTTPPMASRRGGHPAAAPRFQTPSAPRRASTQAPAQPPARPIQVASVPPPLRFQPATSEPAQLSRPATASSPPPTTPAFRQTHPEPRVGDARPRTPSVPPVAFRAPTPTRRGERT